MPHQLPDDVVRLARDRRALLWVCQRYDLRSGAEPHTLSDSYDESVVRYRETSSGTDFALASRYWEAVWPEGGRSPLLRELRSEPDGGSADRRPVVVLAGEADSRASVSSREFLPVLVIPGLLDADAPPDSRFGGVSARRRERVAWSLQERVSEFPGRLLVVVGAESAEDLQPVIECLEDARVVGLTVLFVLPEDTKFDLPESLPGPTHLFSGKPNDLVDAFDAVGMPSSADLPRWSLRIGTGSVELSARDVQKVADHYKILLERDIQPADEFKEPDLYDFLGTKLDSWSAYSSGLPVPRSFRSASGKYLPQEVIDILGNLSGEEGKSPAEVLRVPCEGGAGATTLIRFAAFCAASEGFPALVLRPSQTDVDFEQLMAFSTRLNEAALAAGLRDAVRMLIVLDVEHERFVRASEVARALASQGRNALVLQAVRFDAERDADQAVLSARATADEVQAAHQCFLQLVERWRLPIEVPSLETWRAYESASAWTTPAAGHQTSSVFWVALRFFLTEDLDSGAAEVIQDALGTWIRRRFALVEDQGMRSVVESVAALSSLRIIAPLWTVLRPVTGGSFPSQLVPVLKTLEDVVDWDDYLPEIEDQALRFSHPALAEELLRQNAATSVRDYVQVLEPVIHALSAGHPGDLWVAEQLAIEMVPTFRERSSAEWSWRLEYFENIPPAVRDSSKTILHHWARALYQSADPRYGHEIDTTERRRRLERAISHLERAIDLPKRSGRNEHPSHIYNTLGVAYSRYATCLQEDIGDHLLESQAWRGACEAFDRSLALTGGTNLDALLAYGSRLVSHAETAIAAESNEQAVDDLSHALELIDTATDLSADLSGVDPSIPDQLHVLRARAIGMLSGEALGLFIEELKSSSRPGLGYYCEAQLALAETSGPESERSALRILDDAEENGIELGSRARALQLRLTRSENPYQFHRLRHLYSILEADESYDLRVIDRFRHAVLCYQEGDYRDGGRRFRRLREDARREGFSIVRVRDRLADKGDPARPRLTTARVVRINTEWRADAFVEEIGQTIPLRPRHFSPMPAENEFVECAIRFEFNGPLAVPPRFEERRSGDGAERERR